LQSEAAISGDNNNSRSAGRFERWAGFIDLSIEILLVKLRMQKTQTPRQQSG